MLRCPNEYFQLDLIWKYKLTYLLSQHTHLNSAIYMCLVFLCKKRNIIIVALTENFIIN